MFRFVCVHQHAGNVFVLGKVDSGGPVILWTRPVTLLNTEEAEKIGKNLAKQYGCPYGCSDPYVLGEFNAPN